MLAKSLNVSGRRLQIAQITHRQNQDEKITFHCVSGIWILPNTLKLGYLLSNRRKRKLDSNATKGWNNYINIKARTADSYKSKVCEFYKMLEFSNGRITEDEQIDECKAMRNYEILENSNASDGITQDLTPRDSYKPL